MIENIIIFYANQQKYSDVKLTELWMSNEEKISNISQKCQSEMRTYYTQRQPTAKIEFNWHNFQCT